MEQVKYRDKPRADSCNRPPLPPKPAILATRPRSQHIAYTEQNKCKDSLKERDICQGDREVDIHELELENESLKMQLANRKSDIEKYKQDLARAKDDFTKRESELCHTQSNKMLELESLYEEDKKKMKEEIICLKKALEKEECELKHKTIEVVRLSTKKTNKEISSMKERLAAVCDSHKRMSEEVNDLSEELAKEKNHRTLLEQEKQLVLAENTALKNQLIESKKETEEAIKDRNKLEQHVKEMKHSIQIHTKKGDDDTLQMHILEKVEIIKENLGKGSYGSVTLVRVAGTPCVLKSLHDILVGYGTEEFVSKDQRSSMKAKFYEECKIQWKLHHPNVVQFMGIHYREGSETSDHKKMSLVMEYLPISVDECITKCNKEALEIPQSLKLSILRDVTYGLTQLHLMNIIHRDLSAANILLTSSLKAKIADFGVAKWINPSECLKLSKVPGAQYIMPPEAYSEKPNYSTKLDIFSYGILFIYLLLQEVPYPNSTIETHHVEKKQVEIGKRTRHLNKMDDRLAEMKKIATDCIQDLPEKRPTAIELTKSITLIFSGQKFDIQRDIIKFLSSSAVGKKLLISPEEL